MTRKWMAVSVVFNLVFFLLLACGGGSADRGGPGNQFPTPGKAQAVTGAMPGGRIFAKQTTTTYNWSLVPKAWAQTTTVSLSQSFAGYCNLSPQAGAIVSVQVFGLGQKTSPNCTNSWYFDTDGSGAAANAQTGELLVGNGTISNLVAWTSEGTHLDNANSGLIKVWVIRGTQRLDTGVRCTLGAGDGFKKCGSTATFQGQDGDRVVVSANWQPGDSAEGLNIVFTKQ